MSKLKHYRLSKKMTQMQVAEYLGISQATYSDHEAGKSLLNSEQIISLCHLYECTPNDLLDFKSLYQSVMSELDK